MNNPVDDRAPLLPCPFCGSLEIDSHGWAGNDGRHGPQCLDCGATAETDAAWNRRVTPGATSIEKIQDLIARWSDDLSIGDLDTIEEIERIINR